MFLFGFSSKVAAQYITVDDTKTASELVGVLKGTSSCISIYGTPTASGDNFTSGQNSFAHFKCTSSFPFAEGVILSTWTSKKSIGPYIRDNGGGNTGWSGDTDLNQALTINSINASVLEFDFIPVTSFISFNYIFASNEYQDFYPCRYSDGFAFLIKEKGSTDTYKNLATIPGTLTPVSSTNIHKDIKYLNSAGVLFSCPPQNESYFGQSNISPNNISPINYAGQTQVLKAQTIVIPGKVYHIKLVIADDKNVYYDSAIFLEAGSFTPKIDLGSNHLVCFGETYTLDSGLSASLGYSYSWYKDSSTTPISGENNPNLEVNSPGNYSVIVDLGSGCTATGTVKIDYDSKINLVDTTLKNCVNNTGVQANFDLTRADSVVKNGNSNLAPITYFETLDATTNTLSDPIPNPTNYFYTPTAIPKIVYGEATNSNGCTSFAKVTLAPTFYSIPVSTVFSGTGINDFDGSGNSITVNYPGNSNEYQLVDSINGAIITDFQSKSVFTNVLPGVYLVYVRDSSTCEQVVTSETIYVLDYPHFFTPNGDNFNDTWQIKNLNILPENTIITIFDRYGKLLKEISATSLGWNGTFNGTALPADDYWFNVTFEDGKIIKGHFSLKR